MSSVLLKGAAPFSQDVLQILEAADGLVPLLELQRLVARIVDLRRLFLDALKLGQNFCDVVSFMRI